MTRNLKALTRADIGRLWDCHVDIVTRFTRTYPVPAEFKIFHPELGKEIRVFHEKDALDWMQLVMNSEPHRFENGKYRKKKTFCVYEKRWPAPKCHFTPMFKDESDCEIWWECRHCGHTKLIEHKPTY